MTTNSSFHDFDFLHGRWNVSHRRLTQRLANADEWETFSGTCETVPTMGGLGNVDDNVLHLPGGTYRAVGIRSFDPVSSTWAIWWLDGRNPHTIDVPVVGRFAYGEGVFLADDIFNDQPIVVRFRWSEIASGTPRWEQAFSTDGGLTWEVNWTMRFER
jgi:hypothetical protein